MDKPFWKSKTVWAAALFVAVAALKFYGIELPYDAIITALTGLGLYGVRDALPNK